MERSPLNRKDKPPVQEDFEDLLQNAAPVFDRFLKHLGETFQDIIGEWIYYHDVRYWLLKASCRKKTVFWLTIWEGYFKVTIYLTEKNSVGVLGLDVDESMKEQYQTVKRSGKLIPITVDVSSYEKLDDVMKLIGFKKSVM